MIDGPGIIGGEETASSRLEALRAYRNAWETLTPRKKMTIPGLPMNTSLYELWGGVWAMAGKTAGDPVRAVQLPSIVRGVEMHSWTVPLPDTSRLADFGMDPHQDLLILVNQSQDSLCYFVNLRSLRDGTPHPRANMMTLTPEFPLPGIISKFTIQVMDELLGILLVHELEGQAIMTLLHIWNWTSGELVFWVIIGV